MKINSEARRSLDIDGVLKLISAGTRSDLGKRALTLIEPAADMQGLVSRQNLLAAYLNYTENGGLFPWNDAVQIVSDDLDEARHTGLLLGDELLKVRVLLALASAVRERAQAAREKYPALGWFVSRIREFEDELKALNSSVLPFSLV